MNISKEKFLRILEEFGSDPSKWPNEYSANLHNILNDESLKSLYHEYKALDDSLVDKNLPEMPANLVNDIMNKIK